jgi:hypothetical protein
MGGGENAAIGAVGDDAEELRVLARHDREARRPPADEIEALRRIGAAILDPDDGVEPGKLEQRLVGEIDAGPIGDVVDGDRLRRARRQRGEMLLQAGLRWPRVIRAGDEIAVDRPGRRLGESFHQLARVAAREAEEQRQPPRSCLRRDGDETLRLLVIERQPFARRRGEDQAVDRSARVMPDEPGDRRLIERAVGERRDERQPDAVEASARSGSDALHDALPFVCGAAGGNGHQKSKAPSVSGGALCVYGGCLMLSAGSTPQAPSRSEAFGKRRDR